MTDQKTTPKTDGPVARPAEPGTPAPYRRSSKQLRAGAAQLEAGARVAKLWVELCQNEPHFAELLMPEPMRRALGELARVTAS